MLMNTDAKIVKRTWKEHIFTSAELWVRSPSSSPQLLDFRRALCLRRVRLALYDLTFQSDRLRITAVVQFQSSPFETFADSSTDDWGVLTDSSCEDDRIRAAHAGKECADVSSGAITKDLNCKSYPTVVMILQFFQ